MTGRDNDDKGNDSVTASQCNDKMCSIMITTSVLITHPLHASWNYNSNYFILYLNNVAGFVGGVKKLLVSLNIGYGAIIFLKIQ